MAQANTIKFATDKFSADNMPSASPKDKDVSKGEVEAGKKSEKVLFESAEKTMQEQIEREENDLFNFGREKRNSLFPEEEEAEDFD